jgi:Bacterial regulatory protein, Fis family
MKSEAPFHIWHKRLAALRCRAAVLFCKGNQRHAARLIGLDRTTLWKILRADDALLDARAAREGWIAPDESSAAQEIDQPDQDHATDKTETEVSGLIGGHIDA